MELNVKLKMRYIKKDVTCSRSEAFEIIGHSSKSSCFNGLMVA